MTTRLEGRTIIVKIWGDSAVEFREFFCLKDFFKFLDNYGDKKPKIIVYLAECVIDWSF